MRFTGVIKAEGSQSSTETAPRNQKQSIKKGRGGYRPGAGSGGKRPGAGRPTGAKGTRQRVMITAMNRVQARLGPDAGPLAVLLAVMRDKRFDTRTRLGAAKAAAPYFHRRLPRERPIGPVVVAVTVAAPAEANR